MSTHNKHFIIKQEKFSKISINICFLGYQGTKNKFELAMVNKPSLFKLLRFDCN